VLYSVLIASAVSSSNNTVTASTAVTELSTSYNSLNSAVAAWETASENCNQNLTCVTKQDGTAAIAFNTFSRQLSATTVPAGASADAAKLAADSAAATQDFTLLSKTTTVSQYQSTISSTGLQQTLTAFNSDYAKLINNLQTY
jgi:hypothetical protein